MARKKDKSPRDFKYVQCKLYRTFDPKSFQHDIDQANWEEVLVLQAANDVASMWMSNFMSVVDMHAPFRRLKLRLFAPDWFNSDYLSHIDKREYWCKKLTNVHMSM